MSVGSLRIAVFYPANLAVTSFGAFAEKHVQHFVDNRPGAVVCGRQAWFSLIRVVPESLAEK